MLNAHHNLTARNVTANITPVFVTMIVPKQKAITS